MAASVGWPAVGLGPSSLLERDSGIGVFCEVCEFFKNSYVKTSANG